jgi:hypothetical protein
MSAGQSAANVTIIDSESLVDIGAVDDQFSDFGADFNGTAIALSGYVTANGNMTLTANDSFGPVLGTASTSGADYVGSGKGLAPNMLLSVGVVNVAYAGFTDSGNTYTVEDLTFQSIPAPRAVLLGSIGIGLIGWLRRCRTL